MELTVTWRFVYDDVRLLTSTDPDANEWTLSLVDGSGPVPVEARIIDRHLNWSTADLSRWDDLRRGDPAVVAELFPDARPAVPAGTPFAVAWDVSARPSAARLRFTAPSGASTTLDEAALAGAMSHPIRVEA